MRFSVLKIDRKTASFCVVMEKTKLNLSVPLLSVRRINSGQLEGINRKNIDNSAHNRQKSLCVPKSDCDSIEVTTKPVSVPFSWEQIPGKRRGENGGKIYPCEDPSTKPKLPPGRNPDSREFHSGEKTFHENNFRSQTETLQLKDHAGLVDSLVESMYAEDEVTESKDEVDDNMSTDQHKRRHKFWKIFPRFSVKSSLGILNPFPGTKTKCQALTSSTNEVKRFTRNTPTGHLNKGRKAYSGPLEKQCYDSINKQRFRSGALSGELCKADKRSISNQFSYSSNLFKADGEYPNMGSRSGAISPYKNVSSSSRFNEGTRFLGVPKEVDYVDSVNYGYLRDIPTKNIFKGRSDSLCNVVEKTVYVDSVNYVKTQNLGFPCSKSEDVMESVENQEPNQQQGSKEWPIVQRNGNKNTRIRDNFEPDYYQSYCDVTSPVSPYPPLPKSPSESWLWRTLHTDQINHSPRATNTAIKREITVKSSNNHLSNTYYSEEFLPHGSDIW